MAGRLPRRLMALGAALLVAPCLAAPPLAGLAPERRPDGAPTVARHVQTPEQRTRLLAGVSQPIPATLGFVDRQEAWYTPFAHPGMTGRYDIRGLHAPRSGDASPR